ncbi:hypothetical protein MRB53_033076 [Persea americana]|uniref:Uncharacterized protein n=1 Tax=Persea americana TaxID=3435 RepID=A0ACC2KUJ1_PERAE|nr:hypothetical protein MRB53_033076 [Persea americana]
MAAATTILLRRCAEETLFFFSGFCDNKLSSLLRQRFPIVGFCRDRMLQVQILGTMAAAATLVLRRCAEATLFFFSRFCDNKLSSFLQQRFPIVGFCRDQMLQVWILGSFR